jgi:uroporphyrinogen-III decarboxylase
MDPQLLVEKYGGRIIFWGGGVDTQKTLPFGESDQVHHEVTERLDTFGAKNGFVFATVHNIQCSTPVENVLAMFRALGRKV